MVFCGQCGLQLPPGITRCPRCGALVEENEATRRDLHIDDQTVASPSYIGRNLSVPGQPPSMAGMPGTPPQPLVLRPGAPDYNTQSANDATSMMEASNFNSRTSTPQNMGGSFVGGGYPAQGSYADYGSQAGGYMPTGTAYAGGMGSSMNYGQEQAGKRNEGNKQLRTAGMVIIVIGVLLILSAVILFALQQNGMLASGGGIL